MILLEAFLSKEKQRKAKSQLTLARVNRQKTVASEDHDEITRPGVRILACKLQLSNSFSHIHVNQLATKHFRVLCVSYPMISMRTEF